MPTTGYICRFPAIQEWIPAITEAISKFPTPTNISELHSLFGLVNQLSSSTDTIAEFLSLMRPLLSTKNEFVWSSKHDQALAHAKRHLTGTPTIAFFDVKRPTHICTDASRQGLGFVLQQQSSTGKWVLIQAGSCFLMPAESRYAIIKCDCLSKIPPSSHQN